MGDVDRRELVDVHRTVFEPRQWYEHGMRDTLNDLFGDRAWGAQPAACQPGSQESLEDLRTGELVDDLDDVAGHGHQLGVEQLTEQPGCPPVTGPEPCAAE